MGGEAAGHSQAARGRVCERAAAGVEGERVLGTGQESRVDEGSQGEGAGGAEGDVWASAVGERARAAVCGTPATYQQVL